MWLLVAVLVLFFLSISLGLNRASGFSFMGMIVTGTLGWILTFALVILLGFILYSFFFYRGLLSLSLILGFLTYESLNQLYNVMQLLGLGVLSFGLNFYMIVYFVLLIILIVSAIVLRGFFLGSKKALSLLCDRLFFYLEIILMLLIVVFVFADIMTQYDYVSFASAKINQSNIKDSIVFCNSSENLFYKELCYGVMITDKFSDKNYSVNDLMTICNSVGNSNFIALNKTLCMIQLANLRNASYVCDNITYSNYKNYCYATSTKNSSICSSISDTRIRDNCNLYSLG